MKGKGGNSFSGRGIWELCDLHPIGRWPYGLHVKATGANVKCCC